jgi:hypothetical protein
MSIGFTMPHHEQAKPKFVKQRRAEVSLNVRFLTLDQTRNASNQTGVFDHNVTLPQSELQEQQSGGDASSSSFKLA